MVKECESFAQLYKLHRICLRWKLMISRPGILVLINDADWELEGELDYELQDKDEVVFISTLHGG